jgi:HEAT repeat protein
MPCSRCSVLLLGALALSACGGRQAPQPAIEVALVEAGQGDPHAFLVAATEDLEPGIRGRALGLLILHDLEPGGGSWAPRALFDPNAYVQRQAVQALGARIDEEHSVALLEAFVRRESGVDPYTRSHAAMVLAAAGHTDTLDALSAAWRAESRHWRRAPLALAALTLGDEEALPVLIEDLGRGDFPLEVTFYLDVGRSGRPELAKPLIDGLDLLEETLVLPTAVALVGLDHRKGEAMFRDALGDGNIELRLEAIDYLVDLDDQQVARQLLRKAKSSGPDAVRRYAELALVARGEQGPEPAYEALADVDRELRQQGVWALAGWLACSPDAPRRDRKEAYKLLLATLGDPSPAVVQQAITGLGEVGRSGDRSLLASMLTEDTPGLGVEAAGAMLAIDAKEGMALAAVD